MMGQLAFLATALETAVSELHKWLEDTMNSSSINNLYSCKVKAQNQVLGFELPASIPKDVNKLFHDDEPQWACAELP